MKRSIFFLLFTGIYTTCISQGGYWQQKVKYIINVDLNVQDHRLNGIEKLEYWNNSPDTLTKIFFHLYWNAFHPGSMMSASYHRINKLAQSATGCQQVKWLKINGRLQKLNEAETILEIKLINPILPHRKTLLEMAFEAQVPYEVGRRAGWDTLAGLRYSMAQWYPKLCEYDYEGWHADPYCDDGEFYGVWGDFDVNIHVDKTFVLGATGYLQNPDEIGYGYEGKGAKIKETAGDKLNWHFYAPGVHDFVWAASPEFKHVIQHIPNGPIIHILYNPCRKFFEQDRYKGKFASRRSYQDFIDSSWKGLADAIGRVNGFAKNKFGPYPYKQFSILDGGDDGMEYPMATMVNFDDIPSRSGIEMLDVLFHEFMHSWYYGILGTNETEHPWMDEGFALFAGHCLENEYEKKRVPPAAFSILQPKAVNTGSYAYYFATLMNEEPMATYSDHFANGGYAHTLFKGDVFLCQLGYIVGEQMRDKILREYYRQWQFRHPSPDDFIRSAERTSGFQLGWYGMYWLNTTKTIDFGVDSVWKEQDKTKVRLKKIGPMPMPIDLLVWYGDGSKELFYIPQYLVFGNKPVEDWNIPRTICESWKPTSSTYTIEIGKPLDAIKRIEIDPSQRMADVNRKNNTWPADTH